MSDIFIWYCCGQLLIDEFTDGNRKKQRLQTLFGVLIANLGIVDWNALDKHRNIFFLNQLIDNIRQEPVYYNSITPVDTFLKSLAVIVEKRDDFEDFLRAINVINKKTAIKQMMNDDNNTKTEFDESIENMKNKIFKDWIIQDIIGKGGFGTVYKAIRKTNSNELEQAAIKFINIKQTENPDSIYNQSIINEIEALIKVNHKKIVLNHI